MKNRVKTYIKDNKDTIVPLAASFVAGVAITTVVARKAIDGEKVINVERFNTDNKKVILLYKKNGSTQRFSKPKK